jgi:hypothetical protein
MRSSIDGKTLASFIHNCLVFDLNYEVDTILSRFLAQVEQGRIANFNPLIFPFLRRLAKSSWDNLQTHPRDFYRRILMTYIRKVVGNEPVSPAVRAQKQFKCRTLTSGTTTCRQYSSINKFLEDGFQLEVTLSLHNGKEFKHVTEVLRRNGDMGLEVTIN